jgi:hypothetical protein
MPPAKHVLTGLDDDEDDDDHEVEQAIEFM